MAYLSDNLDNLEQFSSIHAVLGNEACDLDSAVCAYVYAKFLRKIKEPSDIIIPVLNIATQDYALKTEVVYLFEKLGINQRDLVFRDQLDLHSASKTHNLKITLVDQNVLRGDDASLEAYVVEVIDHHKLERSGAPQDITVEMVGSCATLIAERILRRDPDFFTDVDGTLLFGAILTDTANLSPAAKRATPKDLEIAAELAKLVPEVKAEDLFSDIQSAKEDVSKLTSYDLLRKDVKHIGRGDVKVALSSLPMLVVDYLKMADAADSLEKFSGNQGLQGHVLLGTKIDRDSGEIKRELAVCSIDQLFFDKLTKCLADAEEPPLFLDPLATPSTSKSLVIKTFSQGNSTASRKIILPIVKSFLDSGAALKTQETRGSSLPASDVGDLEFEPASHPLTPPSRDDRLAREESPFVFTPPTVPTPNGVHPHLVMSAMQLLTVGDSLHGSTSHSQGSSSYNSCPYTPQNSSAEDALPAPSDVNLPSFNSRDMLEKIESKRGQLLGCDVEESHTYPFTPKNSYVDSNFDAVYQRLSQASAIDSDAIVRKLSEKSRRTPMPDVLEDE